MQVDFRAVERALAKHGFQTVRLTTMRSFVLANMLKHAAPFGEEFLAKERQALKKAGILMERDPYWGEGSFANGPYLRSHHKVLISSNANVHLAKSIFP